MSKKNLLVVGYGAAGSRFVAAMAAKGKYSVTVLQPYDYMEIPLSLTMVLAAGSEAHDKVLFPILQEPHVNYVQGTAVSITDSAVTTNTGQTLAFDVCVLATGQNMSVWTPNPDTEATRAQVRSPTVPMWQTHARTHTSFSHGHAHAPRTNPVVSARPRWIASPRRSVPPRPSSSRAAGRWARRPRPTSSCDTRTSGSSSSTRATRSVSPGPDSHTP